MEMHMTEILAPTNTMEKVRNPCFSCKEYQFHASSMGSGLVGLQAPIPKSGLERRGFSREIIEAISGLNQI